MSQDGQPYNVGAIRKLMVAAFGAEELRRFCQDRTAFRPILADFGPKYNLNDMVDQVINYCHTRLLFDELLAEIRRVNPRQVERFENQILAPGTASTRASRMAEAGLSIPRPPRPHYSRRFPLQANFTGRAVERSMLSEWLAAGHEAMLALVALGGMGKSSLAWYWLQNDVEHSDLDGVVWWAFDEGETGFARFLDESIRYASDHDVDPADIPSSYEQVRTLVNLLSDRRILLVLDGFERLLQAYASLKAAYQPEGKPPDTADARACVDPHAARFLTEVAAGPTRARVLLTSRLMVGDLEGLHGCRQVDLAPLPPGDAVVFMRHQGLH